MSKNLNYKWEHIVCLLDIKFKKYYRGFIIIKIIKLGETERKNKPYVTE